MLAVGPFNSNNGIGPKEEWLQWVDVIGGGGVVGVVLSEDDWETVFLEIQHAILVVW